MNEANTLEIIEIYQSQLEQVEKNIEEKKEHIVELHNFIKANENKKKALMDKLINLHNGLLQARGGE